jgi:hypothetical protein
MHAHRCVKIEPANRALRITYPTNKGNPLAQPNFQFEKRQKELARKKKQEEKKQRKLEERNPQPNGNSGPSSDKGDA